MEHYSLTFEERLYRTGKKSFAFHAIPIKHFLTIHFIFCLMDT